MNEPRSLDDLLRSGQLRRGSALSSARDEHDPLDAQALRGRVCELGGRSRSAVVTSALALLWSAQRAGDPVAWVRATPDVFFSPDAERMGLDLEALAHVRAPCSAGAAVAAELLMRSGAFGALVLDLGAPQDVGAGAWNRLRALAERDRVALVVLTPRPGALDTSVSWRASARRGAPCARERHVTLRVTRDARTGRAGATVEVARAHLDAYA